MAAIRVQSLARLAPVRPDPATDAGLVERFAADRDADAFAELVRRHGPMVLGVCRRALRNAADADDAFQATFLVLARKADAGAVRGPVANWLYGVAVRTAANARRAAARRSTRVSGGADVSAIPARPAADPADAELAARLDAELAALPDKYRAAVVVCELEGRSLKDAADALGVPPGTVASRLARGRDLLAARMRKAVPAASASGLTAVLSESAAARVPAVLLDATAASAFDPALVSEPVSRLIRKVSRDMFLSQLRPAASAGLAVLGLAGATVLGLAADPPKPAPGVAVARADTPPQPGPFTGKPADAGKLVADGNNAFGLDLYGVLAAQKEQQGKNLFFSPFSMEAALGMLAAGASDQAFNELQTGLHLPKDESATDAGFAHLFAKVNDSSTPAEKRGYQLRTANAIYAQKGVAWSPAFADRVVGKYGAGILDADFRADPEKERLRINGWVEKETNEKIKNLLAKDIITLDTVMVLVNAIYFKGDWEAAFKKELTKDAPFTRGDGTKVTAPLMHREGEYALHADAAAGFQAIELPYKGGQVGMMVVLPNKADGLPAVEKALTPDKLAEVAKALATESAAAAGRKGKVEVFLPKFKVESGYEMNEPLKKLGMKTMFNGGLQRLTTSRNDFYVSAVVHKGFVDVNEEGTEAAAATAVVVSNESVAPRNPIFKADHPFLFAIVHKPTNTVLFLGRVEDPTAK